MLFCNNVVCAQLCRRLHTERAETRGCATRERGMGGAHSGLHGVRVQLLVKGIGVCKRARTVWIKNTIMLV